MLTPKQYRTMNFAVRPSALIAGGSFAVVPLTGSSTFGL